jgi:tRNA(fMet)-specific endonuclease VapC
MKYLLDTNICIAWTKGDLAVKKRITTCAPEDIVLCSVVIAELMFGIQKSKNRSKTELTIKQFTQQFRSIPFDDEAAAHLGVTRAILEQAGTPIGPYDLMIAAIAQAHNLIVVTRNIGEFERVPSLSVETW